MTWDLAQTHTWTIVSNTAFAVDDWVVVKYTLNNNSNLQSQCYPVSQCYIFTSMGWVIMNILSAGSTTTTLTVTNMNNGLYRYGGNFYVDHWAADGSLRVAYYLPGLVYTYYTASMTVTITPTLTPQEVAIVQNYWLTDFLNVAVITVDGMWRFNNIQSFWINKPS